MEKIDRFLAISDGSGDGSGSGYGDGSGYGYGSGDGYGDGSGSGYGDGSGSGYGLLTYNCQKVYKIDGIETIVTFIKGNVAKGFIVNGDLTLTDTYIVKIGNYFAHGKTIREAQRDAENKHFDNIDVDEKIKLFKEVYPDNNAKIKAIELFNWHAKLTGSCEQGRLSFCKDRAIDINTDSFTIEEFKTLVNGQYGSDIINKL